MKIIELVPKDKSDIETAQKLFQYSYDDIKEVVPDLLEWLQDMNWPVARYIGDYLLTIVDKIELEILKILKREDLIWNDWLLVVFGMYLQNEQIKSEIIRLAISPSELEKMKV